MLNMPIGNSFPKNYGGTIMKYYTLEEICSIEYGKDHKRLDDGDIPLFGTSGVIRYVNASLYSGPSVMIPRKGTLSGVYFSDKPFWTIDTLFYTKVNEDIVLAKYLYYYLKTLDFNNLDEGTTVPSLTRATLYQLKIPVPSLKEQEYIVSVLESIDCQIELNQAINDNLEAMARQLYEYWFVQFEFPDENGRPYKSSGGKMVWSDELNKEIPALWQVGTILDIATYKNGLACQKYPCQINEVGLPVIKIKEMKQGISSSTQRASKNVPEYALIESGDILFSWSASIEVSIWTGENGVLNQHIFKVIPKDQYFKSFDYFTLQDCVNVFRTIAEARKTTMGHITQDHLKQMPSIIPNVKVLKGFEGILSPILQLYSSVSKENLTLMHRREQLAADLLSGKVKLALS